MSPLSPLPVIVAILVSPIIYHIDQHHICTLTVSLQGGHVVQMGVDMIYNFLSNKQVGVGHGGHECCIFSNKYLYFSIYHTYIIKYSKIYVHHVHHVHPAYNSRL